MTGLSPQFILQRDSRPPSCSSLPRQHRQQAIDNLQWAPDYAISQGYGDAPKHGILFYNWNEVSNKACDLLERAGYACHWCDEWSTCDDCGKAIRTQPDSYSWQPAFVEMRESGELYCFECADFDEYLRDLEDDPRRCCFAHVDPAEYGYVRLSEPDEYESGFHPGQNADPSTILAALHAEGKRRIVFRISDTGQFDVSFETWQRQ